MYKTEIKKKSEEEKPMEKIMASARKETKFGHYDELTVEPRREFQNISRDAS